MYPFFDPLLFKERLVETIVWCTQQLQTSTEAAALRALLPEPADMLAMHRQDALLREFAEQVFTERKKRIQSRNIEIAEHDRVSLKGGILIIFFADGAVAWDGVAQMYSKGYFDFNGFPAWDSWIYHITVDEMKSQGLDRTSNHLISWVPPQFVPYVLDAIAFIMDESTRTLEQARERLDYLKLIDDLIE